MVAADVRRARHSRWFVLQVKRSVRRAKVGHAAQCAAQSRQSWESGTHLTLESELGCIVILNSLRRCVRVVIALISRAQMDQERRANGLIVVHTNRLAADDLIPARRDRIRQAVILTIVLIRTLGRPVRAHSRTGSEAVVDLDAGNRLDFPVGVTAGKVVHQPLAVSFGNQSLYLYRYRIKS